MYPLKYAFKNWSITHVKVTCCRAMWVDFNFFSGGSPKVF